MRIKFVAAVAATIAVLAGCGGQASGPPTLDQVARQIGATDVQRMSPTMFASDEATAMWHGKPIDLAVFANDTLRHNWEQVASQFGPVVIHGHDFAAVQG